MRLTEFLKGTGIYKVPRSLLQEQEEFVRGDDVDGKVQPLLHICERDIDPYEDSVRVILCEELRWDTMYGHYKCLGCKKTFSTKEELGLVWADGKGTGAEIRC